MTIQDQYYSAVAEGRLSHDPAQEAVLDELERIRTALGVPVRKGWFTKPTAPIEGLYLWGGVGRGKSMLMDLLCASVEAPKRRAHFHSFMQWVHAEMAKARARGVDDAIAPVAETLAKEVRFLAFDEMQITDITDAMLVGRLFEKLFAAGVTVVTTSNRRPDDLYKDGLNRQLFLPFIALIKERLTVWELASPTDYRQGRLAGEETYFTPINAASRKAIAEIWAGFGGEKSAPLHLAVKGRQVEIPQFHNGVARANFFDLCGKPLGPADYLALADAARVLILEDIPRLGSENFNAARRFVTLIDALYEAKVRLICSAADQPEMLYAEGEGAFEFERTASRLREMQAEGWGQDT
jgi:cell division protein ZapE